MMANKETPTDKKLKLVNGLRLAKAQLFISAVLLLLVILFSAQRIPQLQDIKSEDALRFISEDSLSLLADREDEIESIRFGPDWVSIYYAEDHSFSIDNNELLSLDLENARAPALSRMRTQYWVWGLIKYWLAPTVLLLTISTVLKTADTRPDKQNHRKHLEQ